MRYVLTRQLKCSLFFILVVVFFTQTAWPDSKNYSLAPISRIKPQAKIPDRLAEQQDGTLSVAQYIQNRIEQLPWDETGNLVRSSWQSAIADPNNAVIATLARLEEAGVSKTSLKRLIDTLMGLGVDITTLGQRLITFLTF